MTFPAELALSPTELHGGKVEPLELPSQVQVEQGWRLSIPPGPSGVYRWAQLDDYQPRPRAQFPWRPPLRLELTARASASTLPGTWGFGLWNDPFSMGLLVSGSKRKLPALPNAAWFFYASPPNYLSFGQAIPAQGFLAGVFSSPPIQSLALLPGALALPLLSLRPAARWVRRMAHRFIREDARLIPVDVAASHRYALEWRHQTTTFFVDNEPLYESPISPQPPLGLVIWIDNQYAAFEPSGRVRFGNLPNDQRQWLEIEHLQVTRLFN